MNESLDYTLNAAQADKGAHTLLAAQAEDVDYSLLAAQAEDVDYSLLAAHTEDVDYSLLITQLEAVTEGERDTIANLSNASALLNMNLPNINWVGFYLVRNKQLVLGPFQGKVACIRIDFGKGVCGTAAITDSTQLVKNVHEFPGHIACDSASNSEIVIPLHHAGKVVGVLDIDSPLLGRFTEQDRNGLEQCAKVIEAACDWNV